MKLLKLIAYLFLGFVLVVGATFVFARFADGPLTMIPGGPLTSGELQATPTDWRFATDIEEIEFESAGLSRTAWIAVHEGQAYIPANSQFPPLKSWHKKALTEPAATIRIANIRYPINLVRIEEGTAEFNAAAQVLVNKYPAAAAMADNPTPGAIWLFSLQPRTL